MLYRFHRILIYTACAGALAVVAWSVHSWRAGGGSAAMLTGVGALAVPVLAGIYLRAVASKYRR